MWAPCWPHESCYQGDSDNGLLLLQWSYFLSLWRLTTYETEVLWHSPDCNLSSNTQYISILMFLSLDLLWEYRIQHGANGHLYVTSSYSTWIFCRGASGFATDCPCGVWCRGLTTCLLHVGPLFGNRILKNSWAVGLTYWIMNLIFLCFDICLDTSDHFLVLPS